MSDFASKAEDRVRGRAWGDPNWGVGALAMGVWARRKERVSRAEPPSLSPLPPVLAVVAKLSMAVAAALVSCRTTFVRWAVASGTTAFTWRTSVERANSKSSGSPGLSWVAVPAK